MANKRLSDKNIDQLLVHYRNERRRLTYQLDLIKSAIADLKQHRTTAGTSDPARPEMVEGTVKRGPGRPRKAVAEKAPGKPGRPPKRVRKVRPLNEWDNAVMEAINQTGRLMPKEEILEHVSGWAAKHQPQLSAEEVEAFLTRTLQKLSGKKKMLGTHHSGLRRGYHYGLIDWFFQSSGKLRRQHYERLVLAPEEELV
ncbi:MAG: hypothetical protein IT230_11510 [Flavobacteriales bacterium]|nr:hypothetical protein [Flavobacteriales bacterium]